MRYLYLFWLLIFTLPAFGQQPPQSEEEEESSFRDKLFFGMGGGLQFGSNATLIAVSPMVGYRVTPKLATGITLTYQYVNYKGTFLNESHTYGGSLFGRYALLDQIFVQTEYEQLNFEVFDVADNRSREWFDRWLLGAGYFANAGGRGGFQLAVLYDLLYSSRERNPYGSPWVYRIGFVF